MMTQEVGVEDPGTHDVGQVGLKTQWLKTIQGLKTQKAQDQEQGTAANLCRF